MSHTTSDFIPSPEEVERAKKIESERSRVVGVDMGAPGGDYTVETKGYIDEKGQLILTEQKVTYPEGGSVIVEELPVTFSPFIAHSGDYDKRCGCDLIRNLPDGSMEKIHSPFCPVMLEPKVCSWCHRPDCVNERCVHELLNAPLDEQARRLGYFNQVPDPTMMFLKRRPWLPDAHWAKIRMGVDANGSPTEEWP